MLLWSHRQRSCGQNQQLGLLLLGVVLTLCLQHQQHLLQGTKQLHRLLLQQRK
jgi:hypothetical protein